MSQEKQFKLSKLRRTGNITTADESLIRRLQRTLNVQVKQRRNAPSDLSRDLILYEVTRDGVSHISINTSPRETTHVEEQVLQLVKTAENVSSTLNHGGGQHCDTIVISTGGDPLYKESTQYSGTSQGGLAEENIAEDEHLSSLLQEVEKSHRLIPSSAEGQVSEVYQNYSDSQERFNPDFLLLLGQESDRHEFEYEPLADSSVDGGTVLPEYRVYTKSHVRRRTKHSVTKAYRRSGARDEVEKSNRVAIVLDTENAEYRTI